MVEKPPRLFGVTGLLSSSGTVIASYYYDSFGNIVEESGNFSNPYRYSGYYYDETSGLYNLNARFYDAKLARQTQDIQHQAIRRYTKDYLQDEKPFKISRLYSRGLPNLR